MKTTEQFSAVPKATRNALIIWSFLGAAGVLLAVFRIGRTDQLSVALLVLLIVVPVGGLCYHSYHLYSRVLDRAKKHGDEMNDLFNSTLSTLALAIDAKDKHTHGHTQRVQKYARAVTSAMDLDREHLEGIVAAALLHDIGKLAIPEYILNKQGALTPEETRKMRMHPQFGADIVANIKFRYPVADSILAHHERFDGQGYPRGLAGHDIPLGARVLSVVDAFDGYVSDRLESKETLEDAIRMIREGSGTAFDPEIVHVWERIYSDVVVWPSTAVSGPHTGIQQAKSELHMLESLVEAIEGLSSVYEIFFVVRARITKCIPGCIVTIERGERDGVPVVFGSKVIATICVDHPRKPLTEDELRLVHAISARIAPALSNAMALEQARREATLDKLTGLSNRRAFEIMSASLFRQHFSIVLIDANSFKAVNDNFGHNAGDATLIRIAAHLRAAFHDAQLLCRLGGDEFLVLSFVGARGLRAQIRRFRQMVMWDPAHESYRKLMFGVSCGLASIPVDAKNVEEAVQIADERMYAVKTRLKQFATRGTASPTTSEKKRDTGAKLRRHSSQSLALKT